MDGGLLSVLAQAVASGYLTRLSQGYSGAGKGREQGETSDLLVVHAFAK